MNHESGTPGINERVLHPDLQHFFDTFVFAMNQPVRAYASSYIPVYLDFCMLLLLQ